MVNNFNVVADDKITSFLSKVSSEEGTTAGLILGQRTAKKDYVVHLAVTPIPEANGSPVVSEQGDLNCRCVSKISQIKEEWFSEHSRNVTRMLPGGMWVLGVFFVTSENIFSEEKALNKIRTIVAFVNKSTANNQCLYGIPPGNRQLVLHYNTKANNYTCKALDSNMTWASVNWKFEKQPVKWHSVQSSFSLNGLLPYDIQDQVAKPIKFYLKENLEKIQEEVEATKCTVNGVFRNDNDSLELIKNITDQQRNTKSNPNEPFKVFLYSLREPSKDSVSRIVVKMAYGEMIFDGIVGSQVYLHDKATVEETVLAVKQDIIRSLASRLEMHWDSIDEAETKLAGKPVHEPPRRVLFKCEDSQISFSDYMYQDETCEDVAMNLQEQLGIRVLPSDLNVNFESPYSGKISPTKTSSMSSGNRSINENVNSFTSSSNLLIYGVIGAVIVLVMSLFLKFFT